MDSRSHMDGFFCSGRLPFGYASSVADQWTTSRLKSYFSKSGHSFPGDIMASMLTKDSLFPDVGYAGRHAVFLFLRRCPGSQCTWSYLSSCCLSPVSVHFTHWRSNTLKYLSPLHLEIQGRFTGCHESHHRRRITVRSARKACSWRDCINFGNYSRW